MDIELYNDIYLHELDKSINKIMDDLVLKFRKAKYVEVEKEVDELVKFIDEDDFYRLVLDYVNCLNFEWPQEIKRLALEEYPVIELICQKYGAQTCVFLDFILFECDHEEEDLRHLHSGAIHLLLVMALRGIRRDITIDKIKKESDKIYYIYSRTRRIFDMLVNDV
mgnify:CR=1 FL=1